jgi:hypothetical protein
MKALILYVGFVVASVAAAVLIASYVELQTSPQVGTIVMLALFFTGLVVSWIATVFVMSFTFNNEPRLCNGRVAVGLGYEVL